MKQFILLITGFVAVLTLASCTSSVDQQIEQNTSPGREEQPSKPLWQTYEFTDVTTNETFSIDDYDKPVLIESFAVWCPPCTKQQYEVKALHEQTKNISSVAINTEPNEDAAKVRTHVQSNNFTWPYAVTPRRVTQSFVDDFGVDFLQAPKVPMLVHCPSGNTTRLPDGVKTANRLKSLVDQHCAS